MEILDITDENLTCLYPKVTKRRRRLSILSVRKHFRKSIPSKSMSIIEISSSDCESLKSADSSADIDESEIRNPNSLSVKDTSDSEEIISPSPKKNIKQLNCLSSGMKKGYHMKLDRNGAIVQDTENKKMTRDVCNKEEELSRNLKPFLEFTILDYDQFQKPKIVSNPSMNSTMIQPEEIKQNLLEIDIQDNSILNTSVESVNKSFENLLDDLYGDTWRPYREEILPPSERKPPIKKIIVEKPIPATERKAKKSEIHKNPYLENEKLKSNNLLRALHTRRIREAIESPLIQNLKALCDEESSGQSDVAPSIPRIKLSFNENKKSLEDMESENLKENNHPMWNNDIHDDVAPSIPRIKLSYNENQKSLEDMESENLKENDYPMPMTHDIENICWSDEQNSLQYLPLKDRIAKKKLLKEKNTNNREKDKADVIIHKNPNSHIHVSPDKNEFDAKSDANEDKSKKKGTLYLDAKIDNISDKRSSSGFSSESNEREKKNIQKVNKKIQRSRKNRKSLLGTSSISHELIQNLEGNVGDNVDKGVTSTKNSNEYSDSSDEIEINKEVATHEADHSKLEDSHSSDENIVKKITKILSKTKIASNCDVDSNEIPDCDKGFGKTIKKKVLRAKPKNQKYFSENSSDSDDGLVEYNKEVETKKTDQSKMYSFLASLSSSVPDHQCDPTAKIFKANFVKNRESLAKKLFQLFNRNVFDNLIPESVPLEWNARMLCTAGYCYSKKVTHRNGNIDMEARIVLSTKVLTTPDRLRDTLIHEMCHAATWLVDKVRNGHGKFWKAWASKAKKVYPELPPIKTCHNYEISSKYVYKCTGCGYEVKRHRKSLDIEKKRCGYCCGKFQILINKVNKKGEQKLVPLIDTPKKEPKGFAAFYQENYANYKSPNTTPAQVMKLLSNKFKEMKVQ